MKILLSIKKKNSFVLSNAHIWSPTKYIFTTTADGNQILKYDADNALCEVFYDDTFKTKNITSLVLNTKGIFVGGMVGICFNFRTGLLISLTLKEGVPNQSNY
jgi:WD40 repeat protein